MSEKETKEVLAAEIQQDAQKRAERALSHAREEADKILMRAREEAKSEVEKILGEARARTETRRDMVLRSVDQEVNRRKMEAREQIIRDVTEQADEALGELSAKDYEATVVRLAAQAIRSMPAQDFSVIVSSRPNETIDADRLQTTIAAELAKQNCASTLRVEIEEGAPAGVVITSGDGKLQWDNTFEARLRRFQAFIRRSAASVLFEKT